jgi:hypothetical protein
MMSDRLSSRPAALLLAGHSIQGDRPRDLAALVDDFIVP